MRIPQEKKIKVVEKRKKGFSIPELSRLFSLPKSSISRIVKGVEIPTEFKERWLERRNASKIIAERAWQKAKFSAIELLNELDQRTLVAVISALYWAEGDKKGFSLSNTDPKLIYVFINGIKNIFKVKNEDIKVSIRIYEDLDRDACITFWSKVVGFELKNNVSINVLHGNKKGKLQYGMCRVRIRKSGLIFKTISVINNRIYDLISS